MTGFAKFNSHEPLVNEVMTIASCKGFTLKALAKQSGYAIRTLRGWKYTTPPVTALSDVAQTVGMKLVLVPGQERPISNDADELQRLARAVCAEFKITLNQLMARNRRRIYARPRQIFMYLARRPMGHKLVVIQDFLKLFDHTTVHHGVSTIERLMKSDPVFSLQVSTLIERWKVLS